MLILNELRHVAMDTVPTIAERMEKYISNSISKSGLNKQIMKGSV